MWKVVLCGLCLAAASLEARISFGPNQGVRAEGVGGADVAYWYDTKEIDGAFGRIEKVAEAHKVGAVKFAREFTLEQTGILKGELTKEIEKANTATQQLILKRVNAIPKEVITQDMVKEMKDQVLEELKNEWRAQLDPAFVAELKTIALEELKAELKTLVEAQTKRQ